MQVGPYRVIRELARGGMGVVYLAQDAAGSHVALKLLHAQPQGKALQRFALEAKALSRLRHPNLVSLIAAGEQAGRPWLALDYIPGQTLQERLHAGPLPIWEAIRIAQQLAGALSYLHGCGILHRDLKPDNVLLQGSQALLTDFGLVLDDDAATSRLTATGIFLGTPGYWAPEQARGDKQSLGPGTDLYGLGAVLYACLTGRAPVTASSLQDYLTQADQRRQPPRELRPDVPAWLDALCLNCLALDPQARPTSAEEVARALILAETEGGSTRTGRRPLGLMLLAAAVVLVAGLALALWPGSSGSRSDAATLERAEAALKAGRAADALAICDTSLRTTPEDDAAHLMRARVLATLGRPEEALEAVDAALSLNPSAEAYGFRAHALLDLRRYDELLQTCAAGLRLYPDALPLHHLRGRAHLAQSDDTAALTAFERALEVDPDRPGLHAARGQALLELDRTSDALAAFEEALRLAPEFAPALALRGVAQLKLHRYADAIADSDAALRLEPERAIAYDTRGRANYLLGNDAAALADLDRALELAPDLLATLSVRGQVHLEGERYAAALEDSNRLLSRLPHHVDGLITRGVARLHFRRSAEALADFDHALQFAPNHADALTHRALALTNLGRYAEALPALERSLRLDPRRALTHAELGRAQHALARYAEALAACDRALELNPKEPTAADTRARTLGAMGRFQDCVEACSDALQLSPTDAELYSLRARAYVGLGQDPAAIEDFDRALELTPRQPKWLLLRGLAKARLEQLNAALADLNLAIEFDPDYGEAYANRAAIHYAFKRYPETIEDCDRALQLELTPENKRRTTQLRDWAADDLGE